MSPSLSRFDLLLQAAKEGLRHTWIPELRLHRLQLIAEDLQWPGVVQHGLFDQPPEQAERLARIKREVNAKLGRFTLRSRGDVVSHGALSR